MNIAWVATYYRTALLLGIVRGETVLAWAAQVIEREPEPPPPFFELITVSANDLSELRHALWPLVTDPPPLSVLEGILAQLSADLDAARRGLGDTLTIVRQMRSMVKLPAPLYASLNAALVEQAADPSHAALGLWLRQCADGQRPH